MWYKRRNAGERIDSLRGERGPCDVKSLKREEEEWSRRQKVSGIDTERQTRGCEGFIIMLLTSVLKGADMNCTLMDVRDCFQE